MLSRLTELIRGLDRHRDGYSRALQAARVRAAYQRAYFAPALFNLIPVKTDLIASMAVDSRWRLYYNDEWLNGHTVEENAAVLIHEVSHLLRSCEARKHAAAVADVTLWNTAADCEMTTSSGKGCRCPTIRRSPARPACRRAKPPRCYTSDDEARAIGQRERLRHPPTTNDRPGLRFGRAW